MRRVKIRRYRKTNRGFRWKGTMRSAFRLVLIVTWNLLPLLPLVAIAVVFMLPKTPHLRVSYTYTGSYAHPHYIDCHYLGVHGTVRTVFGSRCPIVAMIAR